MRVVHAVNIVSDYTLCGFAYEELSEDESDRIEHDEEVAGDRVAEFGQLITCQACLAMIRYCKSFKGNRQPVIHDSEN